MYMYFQEFVCKYFFINHNNESKFLLYVRELLQAILINTPVSHRNLLYSKLEKKICLKKFWSKFHYRWFECRLHALKVTHVLNIQPEKCFRFFSHTCTFFVLESKYLNPFNTQMSSGLPIIRIFKQIKALKFN